MNWIANDVTGWTAAASLVATILGLVLTERIILRRFHEKLLNNERERGDGWKQSFETERERNDVIVGGLVDIVKEIRAAVQDPRRPL